MLAKVIAFNSEEKNGRRLQVLPFHSGQIGSWAIEVVLLKGRLTNQGKD